MSEVNEDPIKTPQTEEAAAEAEPNKNSALEERARRMGWIDEESFNGPQGMWRDAETFIERGENELPILRDRLRKQDNTIVEMGASQATMKKDMDYMKGATERAEKRGYEEGLAAAKTKQREAVVDGDTEKFDEAQAEIDALAKPADVPASEPEVVMPPEITEFTGRNKAWYGSDLGMTSFADKEFDAISSQYPGFSLQQQLETVEANVKSKYPDKFGNPRRSSPGEVEGGSSAPLSKKKSGKAFSDLPTEAQEMCDRFVKQGLFKDRAAYVKEYEFDG